MDFQTLINIFTHMHAAEPKAWVAFRHGTCVILDPPHGDDVIAAARGKLAAFDADCEGGLGGDVQIMTLPPARSWVVCNRPDIISLVSFQDPNVAGLDAEEVAIGVAGSMVRARDAAEQEVIFAVDALDRCQERGTDRLLFRLSAEHG
jgi:hypothetical protein